MPKFNVSEEEWCAAKEAFKSLENTSEKARPVKLSRANKALKEHAEENKDLFYSTEHSFFKFSQHLPGQDHE